MPDEGRVEDVEVAHEAAKLTDKLIEAQGENMPQTPKPSPKIPSKRDLFAEQIGNTAVDTATKLVTLEKQSLTDTLTGLPNRRHFDQRLEEEIKRSARTQQPLSLLLLDLDHFKKINDTYGHAAGDKVLTAFAQRIGNVIRGNDIPARYGGEEFAIILPETDHKQALDIAQRVHKEISETQFVAANQKIKLTTSIGLAQLDKNMQKPEDLTSAADSALYAAKQAGRNQVQTYTPTPSS